MRVGGRKILLCGMKILLIGDSCIDTFIYGSCDRLNPEAPTPIFTKTGVKTTPGMVDNVNVNMRSLGVSPHFITHDEVITKTRYVDEKSNYILLRVDDDQPIKKIDSKMLVNIQFHEFDAVVISDYNKGFLDEESIEYILVNSNLSFIDTKKPLGGWVTSASFIKINEAEFNNPNHELHIIDKLIHKIIVTKGDKGCDLNGLNYPTIKAEVRDVVGAGDTFLSAFSLAMVKTNNIETSIFFANECATHVIQKRGVSDLEDMYEFFKKL